MKNEEDHVKCVKEGQEDRNCVDCIIESDECKDCGCGVDMLKDRQDG